MGLVVVDRNPQRSVLGQQEFEQLQPIPHQRQPSRMLKTIVIVLECAAGIIGWIDEDAFHRARIICFQRLEPK